jgi:hypothetical protein
MQKIKQFLVGKKTYIGASLLALIAIFGWWTGVVSGAAAAGMLAAAFGIAGLGAKAERLAAVTLEALNEAKRVQSVRAQGARINWAEEGQVIAQLVKKAVEQVRSVTVFPAQPLEMTPGTMAPNAGEGKDPK